MCCGPGDRRTIVGPRGRSTNGSRPCEHALSAWTVRRAAVLDAKHDHGPSFVVDAVQHSVRASTSAVDTSEFVAQHSARAVWVVDQRSGDAVDDRCAHGLRTSLGKSTSRWTGDDQFVSSRGHRGDAGRKARTASTPRTVSPAVTAASASINARTASWSLNSSSVSSRLSRSSGLIKTAAGRPLRVTTIRSCSRSTRSTNSENRSFTLRSESTVMATIVPRVPPLGKGLTGASDPTP